jgi:hypothetical protein
VLRGKSVGDRGECRSLFLPVPKAGVKVKKPPTSATFAILDDQFAVFLENHPVFGK